jgi:metal-dependent amidase/aminoacylase/carboxypeptidase family protein
MCNAKIQLKFFDALPAVVNDPWATVLARKAACKTVGKAGVMSQGAPSLGGEDFSFYQQLIPGCMVRFGGLNKKNVVGPAHSARFNFDEKVFKYGTGWLVQIACQSLAALNPSIEVS